MVKTPLQTQRQREFRRRIGQKREFRCLIEKAKKSQDFERKARQNKRCAIQFRCDTINHAKITSKFADKSLVSQLYQEWNQPIAFRD